VLVGGVAAVVEGAPVTTFDVDVVHERSARNVRRLRAALNELGARYRTRPELDRSPSSDDLLGPGHHLLSTRLGPLDVLGVIGKERSYPSLVRSARRRKLGSYFVPVLDLRTQIAVKRESRKIGWRCQSSKRRCGRAARAAADPTSWPSLRSPP
jgi:hypothetical protein